MAESADHGDTATFAVYRDEFHSVLGSRFRRTVLTETNAHEGPVYVAAEHALYFTTLPEPGPKNIAIKRLQLAGEEFPFEAQALGTVQFPSNMANGMTLDRDGRLVICEQGTRETPARISRMDLKTRAVETVVDQWRGLRFNSPNDVVVRAIAPCGSPIQTMARSKASRARRRSAPTSIARTRHRGDLGRRPNSFNKPNGLAFSPDKSVLHHRHRR